MILRAWQVSLSVDQTGGQLPIGHFGGRPLVERYGRYVLLTTERLDKATGFFDRHGGKVVTIARFIEGLRQANGIIAGISGMHWARFLAFNALGAALWVAVWTSVGYFSGSHINTIYDQATRYSTYVAIGFGAVVLAYIARRLWKHHRKRAGPEEAWFAGRPDRATTAEPRVARYRSSDVRFV